MTKKLRYELVLLTAVGVASVLSGIAPASRTVWFTEMFWAWGLLAILLLTYRRFKFSTAAYSCFFVWSLLQIVGAHWTFERVPMEWLTTPLGLERNPFDRIAHFAVGWFAFPLSELYWRKGYVRSKVAAVFFAVMTTVAMAGLWEIVEWLYAAIDGGEAGAAFLGSQGDEWDAQKDILCDTFGAICSTMLFLLLNRFRHFKDNRYRLEGVAKDSETMEEMVVYRELYGDGGLWVRPAKMFFETVERDGKRTTRFTVPKPSQERSA